MRYSGKILLSVAVVLCAALTWAQTSKKTRKKSGPRICFTSLTQDAGDIAEGPEQRFKFPFQNCSDEPVIITHMNSSCGCLVPDWHTAPVLPGKWDTVYATYSTQGRPGAFTKTLYLQCNDTTICPEGRNMPVLTVKGRVMQAQESNK